MYKHFDFYIMLRKFLDYPERLSHEVGLTYFTNGKQCFAEQGIMYFRYLADRSEGDDELSMIGEFGFLLANGNTNTSTYHC